MKYIKTYDALQYSEENKKFVNKLRYSLNKVFADKNNNISCGVEKVKYLKADTEQYYTSNYIDYTGNTMLYSIYVTDGILPSEKIKVEKYKKIANEIGLLKEYPTSNMYIGSEEKMIELINRLKNINTEIEIDKYNI